MLGSRLLCTISKWPKGIRLLRVGTSIHLFIVSGKRAAGAIFLKEFCISPVSPVTRNRPFPKSLYIPAFFVFVPFFRFFLLALRMGFIFSLNLKAVVSISRTFDLCCSRRAPQRDSGSGRAGGPAVSGVSPSSTEAHSAGTVRYTSVGQRDSQPTPKKIFPPPLLTLAGCIDCLHALKRARSFLRWHLWDGVLTQFCQKYFLKCLFMLFIRSTSSTTLF